MSTPPELTIGIPCYCGAELLADLLYSIRQAKGNPQCQILVCDDGSPELEALKLLETAQAFDAKLLRRSVNGGCYASYNTIFEASSAPYVALFDNDVTIPPTWITTALELIRNMSSVGVLSWMSRLPTGGQEDAQSVGSGKTFLEPATELASYSFLLNKDSWKAVYGFDDTMRHARGDSDICVRLAKIGHISYRVHYPLVTHREHATISTYAKEIRLDIQADIARFNAKWGRPSVDVERGLLS